MTRRSVVLTLLLSLAGLPGQLLVDSRIPTRPQPSAEHDALPQLGPATTTTPTTGSGPTATPTATAVSSTDGPTVSPTTTTTITATGTAATPTASTTATSTDTISLTASVRASAYTVQIGDTVIVTGTLTNGSSRSGFGIPQYRLDIYDAVTHQIQSTTTPWFTPAQPTPITPGGSVGPGSSQSVQWTVTAVRSGTVYFGLLASGEILDPNCGCFRFMSSSGSSPVVTVNNASYRTLLPFVQR